MSIKSSESVSYSVRAAVALILGASAMMASAGPAMAADDSHANTVADNQTTAPAGGGAATAAAPVTLEEVTVTGTRIRRRDLQSTSPLVTIDSAQIESKAGLNIESYLNQMPNYNPARTPTTENFDVQPSAVNTVGISTISLRGLGANRGLVLIDGHRTTPINALMVTDINGIPAMMIDRIETITGGASAVYGADAMAGVTNFILKKNFQGAQIDAQDSETQAGDGNEADVSGLMGTNFADGKGNITMGLEWYNRDGAYQRNRSFYTNEWYNDPNAPQTTSNALFVQGFNGYNTGLGVPSAAAIGTLFPGRPAGASSVFGFGSGGAVQTLNFQPNGNIWIGNGPLSTSNYAGPTGYDPNIIGGGGYGLQNAYDGTMQNTPGTPPNEVQTLKWNNPLAYISSPQTRYSFYAQGHYNITDDIQFYTTARYAESKTATLLPTPTTSIFGWEANVPFNATTDSPINPALITSATSQSALQAIYNSFTANPTATNPNWNPGYIGPGQAGAQHPVPWQLALALDSRGAAPGGTPALSFLGPFFGGAPACFPEISKSLCATGATSSWMLWYLPQYGATQRSTVDLASQWQIETGFRFPLYVGDWTGELYYSRGQSLDYEQGLGNDSLQRFRAVIDSPDYGAGQSFQGNANGANVNFGTSVPTTCTSGFYNSIFNADVAPSADCTNAIDVTLQTMTQIQQDVVEANFNGSIIKLPAGELSAAVGFQYRRDAAQFQPDELQSTSSFLDQTIGLYPLGTVNQQIQARDGYAELFVPVLSDLPGLKKLDLDVGGRYSSYNAQIPNATTFKVNVNAQLLSWLRLRGGFNRATRAPNLGELYLGEQEYFGGGAQFGDPCSVRSNAPFGAGGAAADTSSSAGAGPTKVVNANGAAGALSTLLICQAQMGGVGSTAETYYYNNTNQAGQAAGAVFAWLNEAGNPNLSSETGKTWTGGFVISQISDNPLLSGFSSSIDWWQIRIDNAIELDSPDYANYLCYGTVTVTNAAQAAAQAASPACQNVGRLASDGAPSTALLTYTNQATIGVSGEDVQLNWLAQFADLGVKFIPGSLAFNTQATVLNYYRTKQSPAVFDVDVNWKGSQGPTLAGIDPGAYSFRTYTTISYILPSVSVNFSWQFLPSANTANKAFQQAIIANNQKVTAGGKGEILSYTPNTDIAVPAYNLFNLSASWNINQVFQIRGGINNLFNKDPAVTGASAGFPVGTNLSAVCGSAPGCVNPLSYSLPSDGGSFTNPGFYDVYGRTFFLGFRANF